MHFYSKANLHSLLTVMCVCVCVCILSLRNERERERERTRIWEQLVRHSPEQWQNKILSYIPNPAGVVPLHSM